MSTWRFSAALLIILAGCSDAQTEGPDAQTEDRGFVDLADEAGLGSETRTYGADSGDFNGDGAPDLVVTYHSIEQFKDGPLDALYRNVDGEFLVHQELPSGDRHDCTFGDPNGDEKLDLYCTTGAFAGSGLHPNELWMQQPDGTFVDVAEEWGVTDPPGRGRKTTFLDVDGDGWQDLFVANLSGRTDELSSANHLFLNEGGTAFRPAPEYGVDLDLGAGHCARGGDVVPGGGVDLLVCTGPESGLRLYANQGGEALANETQRWGLDGIAARQALAEDLDGDGELELLVVGQGGVDILEMTGQGFDTVHSVPAVGGRDITLGDVDGDGDRDLYVLRTGFEPCLDESADDEWDDRADFILTRDGEGLTDWTRHDVPHTGRGCGNVVVSLDGYDGDRAAFVVLNGYRRAQGPIQLIVAE